MASFLRSCCSSRGICVPVDAMADIARKMGGRACRSFMACPEKRLMAWRLSGEHDVDLLPLMIFGVELAEKKSGSNTATEHVEWKVVQGDIYARCSGTGGYMRGSYPSYIYSYSLDAIL